jgi:hypothetical protein
MKFYPSPRAYGPLFLAAAAIVIAAFAAPAGAEDRPADSAMRQAART